tara:strand:+ start:419 stop:1006 length:588 start_codon:yes stop_codon:yes gene_type:complete
MFIYFLKKIFIYTFQKCFFLIFLIHFFHQPLIADQNDERLNELFYNLKSTASVLEASLFEIKIWDIWMEHKNPKASFKLFLGLEAMKNNEFEDAFTHFSKLIKMEPEFAEGWNKRATVLFLMGRYSESEDDVIRTLELEPRHFGALSGRGLIRMSMKDWSGAIEVLEKGLKINPHMKGAIKNLKFAKKKFKESMT